MTEQARGKRAGTRPAAAGPPRPGDAHDGDDAERLLGRIVARGLPVLSIVCAVLVGLVASVGSGLLVLASGALLGTIALLWASVRTLTGDAPLPADLEALAAESRDVDALAEQKRRLLRAIKDIESEHAIGKLDDADYEAFSMQYRSEAKALMREMDESAAPSVAEADRVARAYLEKLGLGPADRMHEDRRSAERQNGGDVRRPGQRVACAECSASNEADAAFCKKCGAKIVVGEPMAADEHDATS